MSESKEAVAVAPHVALKKAWSELTQALLNTTTTATWQKPLIIKVDRLIVQLEEDVEVYKQVLLDDYATHLYSPDFVRCETDPALMGK